MKRKFVVELISFLLMSLFLYAAFSRWFAFWEFRNEIDNQPYSNRLTPYIIYSIPPIEVLIALTLMFEKTRTIGLYASLILMSVFSLYTIAVLMKLFAYVPCSCGGFIKGLSWSQHLILTISSMIVSIAGLVLRRNSSGKNGPTKSMVVAG